MQLIESPEVLLDTVFLPKEMSVLPAYSEIVQAPCSELTVPDQTGTCFVIAECFRNSQVGSLELVNRNRHLIELYTLNPLSMSDGIGQDNRLFVRNIICCVRTGIPV